MPQVGEELLPGDGQNVAGESAWGNARIKEKTISLLAKVQTLIFFLFPYSSSIVNYLDNSHCNCLFYDFQQENVPRPKYPTLNKKEFEVG